MRIHVIDLVGVDAATAQGIEHTAPGAVASRRSDVMSIGAHALADKLAIDARPALTGMLVFFQYQCARAFAHYKAVAVPSSEEVRVGQVWVSNISTRVAPDP